jgi:NAD(P)-dependent dehydrogenase (short-subunit alcohol dehydrogenase family)
LQLIETGMIALVTGATDGIGKETARELTARGWKVLVHGRSRKKAQTAAGEVGGIPVWGDLSHFSEVRALADQVGSLSDQLDVLINNAGILARAHRLTDDGFEETLQVNHLSPFLLTHLLLPRIRGRILNVSSGVHGGGEVEPFEHLNELSGYDAYAASKLGNILFTFALARRVKLPVVALHPGVIATKLLRAGFGGMGGGDVAQGAATSVMLATAAELPTARYYSNLRETQPSARSRDPELQERFYAWSAEKTGVSPL